MDQDPKLDIKAILARFDEQLKKTPMGSGPGGLYDFPLSYQEMPSKTNVPMREIRYFSDFQPDKHGIESMLFSKNYVITEHFDELKIIERLKSRNSQEAIKIFLESGDDKAAIVASKTLQEEVFKCTKKLIKDGRVGAARHLCKIFSLSDAYQKAAVEQGAHEWFDKRQDLKAFFKEIKKRFKLQTDVIQALKEECYQKWNWEKSYTLNTAERVKMQQQLGISVERGDKLHYQAFISALSNHDVADDVISIHARDLNLSLPEMPNELVDFYKARILAQIGLERIPNYFAQLSDKDPRLKEIFADPQILLAAQASYIAQLSKGHLPSCSQILSVFNLSEDFLSSDAVLKAKISAAQYWIEQGDPGFVLTLLEGNKLREFVLNTPDSQIEFFRKCVERSRNPHSYPLSLQNLAKLVEDGHLSRDVMRSSRGNVLLGELLVRYIERQDEGNIDILLNRLCDEKIRLSVNGFLVLHHLTQGDSVKAQAVIGENVSLADTDIDDRVPPLIAHLCRTFKLNNLEEIASFVSKEPELYNYLIKEQINQLVLESSDVLHLNKLYLNILEADSLKRAGVDLKQLAESGNYKLVYDRLCQHYPQWPGESSDKYLFEQGAQVFGYKEMFAFLHRLGLSRHAGLSEIHSIVKLQKASGLKTNEFYNQILSQVCRDDARYEAGTAHHAFNELAASLDLDFEKRLRELREVTEIPKIAELMAVFNNKNDIFKTWSMLRRFADLQQFLQRAEMLQGLQELRKTGQVELAEFIETVAFHPHSKVDLQALIEFWQNPAQFFARGDTHAPKAVHAALKPSNYFNQPLLDFNAVDLRDGIVKGKLDTIQAFAPMSVKYRIPIAAVRYDNLSHALRDALGSRKDNIRGKAVHVEKLFHEVKLFFKSRNLLLLDYLAEKVNLNSQDLAELGSLVFNSQFGLRSDSVTMIAKMHAKSSTEAALVGNDTASCMSFGSGKFGVYWALPGDSQFTVQLQVGEDRFRTISQSLMTADRQMNWTTQQFLQNFQGSLSNEELEQLKFSGPLVAAADNVQTAVNYQGQGYPAMVAKVMADFFCRYFDHYTESAKIYDTQHIAVGLSQTLKVADYGSKPNNTIPCNLPSYSDKSGETALALKLNLQDILQVQSVQFSSTLNVQRGDGPIRPLTYWDVLDTAQLESQIYGKSSLHQGVASVQNQLVAKDLNNAIKDRPNLSIKHLDANGNMNGYLIAYEGRREASDLSSEKIIYIADLAALPSRQLVGRKLIDEFVTLYAEHYAKNGKLYPIVMELRESTSLKIVRNRLDKCASALGLVLNFEEIEVVGEGENKRHIVVIRPLKKPD